MIPRILIVDDTKENRQYLISFLKENLKCEVIAAKSGEYLLNQLDSIKSNPPDLILLDILMPNVDGYSVAKQLRKDKIFQNIPIIFLSSLDDVESKIKAFNSGGADYVSKPFNPSELLARVRVQLELKAAKDELIVKNQMLKNKEIHLSHLVDEKIERINRLSISLVGALENANLFNDSDTGNHIKRVSYYSEIIAYGYKCKADFIKRLGLYAPLHDVGKVGLPDHILKKPGKYTEDEYEQMKEHVIIGAKILGSQEIDPMAKNIALYHHEKWDGTGYVNNLKGEEIPLEAQIVAIADVYDALCSKRSYKKALPEDEVDAFILKSKGSHFNPKLIDVFFENKDRIIRIRNNFK